MATHSSILAWEIPWTEEPGGLESMGSYGVRHGWTTNTFTLTAYYSPPNIIFPSVRVLRLLWKNLNMAHHGYRSRLTVLYWFQINPEFAGIILGSLFVPRQHLIQHKCYVNSFKYNVTAMQIVSSMANQVLLFETFWNFFFPNIFYPQLVESTAVLLGDTEGWLYMFHKEVLGMNSRYI